MITNFIHNRKDPAINLIKGYCRTTLIRAADPALRQELRAAWDKAGMTFAGHHYLATATEKMAKYDTVGQGKIRWSRGHRGSFKTLKAEEVKTNAVLYAYMRVSPWPLFVVIYC